MRLLVIMLSLVLTIGILSENSLAQEQPVELHFTEGFAGEEITVSINEEEVRRFSAKTRFQIGVAEIVHLQVSPGDVVGISVGDLETEETITLAEPPLYVIVRFENGELILELTDEQQRYL